MRLIDADAFIKMMEEKCDPESTLDPWVLSVCRGGVKIMPTVDAVPVVRCKDCRYFGMLKVSPLSNAMCLKHTFTHTPDDFCSRGERKDGDHETD